MTVKVAMVLSPANSGWPVSISNIIIPSDQRFPEV